MQNITPLMGAIEDNFDGHERLMFETTSCALDLHVRSQSH